MHYLITGATGFIGSALVESLLADGHIITVLSREPSKAHHQFSGRVAVITLDQVHTLNEIDAVVNLAGAPIVDKRWSEARKRLLLESRIDFTAKLIELLHSADLKPAVFLSGSAIGYYGNHDDENLTEESEVHEGFTHSLCRDWELAAMQAEALLGSRVCLLRTGVVLGKGGGAVAKMLLPFKLGLGGPIGSGKQWMSWIHLDDEVGAIRFLLANNHLQGAFNLTAPTPANNATFAKTLGAVLHRPACLPMPAFVMTLALGEASELLLKGQRVLPKRLNEAGYVFKYPSLQEALQAAV